MRGPSGAAKPDNPARARTSENAPEGDYEFGLVIPLGPGRMGQGMREGLGHSEGYYVPDKNGPL